MSRRTKPLECSESDLLELQRLVEDSGNPRAAERARMVLACAKGMQIKAVAAMLSERPNTVIKWKRRYEEMGIGGLFNAPRGSAKDVYGEPFARRLRELLESTPPNGEKYWTGPLLAEALGTPDDTIRRYLRKEKIQLLEYRRHVKEDAPTSEPGDTRSGLGVCDAAVYAQAEDAAPAQEESGASTLEKRISVSISSTEDLRDAGDGTLAVQVTVRLIDQNGCVLENQACFPGALPRLGQFDVTIRDTL